LGATTEEEAGHGPEITALKIQSLRNSWDSSRLHVISAHRTGNDLFANSHGAKRWHLPKIGTECFSLIS
jgi:hypothetical protein